MRASWTRTDARSGHRAGQIRTVDGVGCNLCEGDVDDPGVIFGDAERL
jgi:hypothetical protein